MKRYLIQSRKRTDLGGQPLLEVLVAKDLNDLRYQILAVLRWQDGIDILAVEEVIADE